MRRYFLAGLLAVVGCASTGFHEGRTSLRKDEQRYLVARKGTPKGVFDRFWESARWPTIGLVQWDGEKSSACPEAPGDLLQSVRDELGRVNQRNRSGENIALAVTIYRYQKAGTWSKPTAYYELVARDPRGQVVWAADDKVVATEDLARSLVDAPSAIMGREILRKVREQLGI
jgi:hypothetical protein